MLDNHIGGLLVMDEAGQLVGVLTEGDLLRRSESGNERHRPRWLEVLMGERIAGAALDDVVRLMHVIASNGFGCSTVIRWSGSPAEPACFARARALDEEAAPTRQ
jgi:CBS domain-containing protein